MKKKLVATLLAIMMVLSTPSGVHAASLDEVRTAYINFLTNKSALSQSITGSDYKFALVDINNDGIPEMIVTGDDGYHANIMAYVNGKVKAVEWSFSGGADIYPSKSIYFRVTGRSSYDESYSKFTGKNMKELCHVNGNYSSKHNDYIYKYYIGNKKVSKTEYMKYTKKLVGNAMKLDYTFHKNTKENRERYLSYLLTEPSTP